MSPTLTVFAITTLGVKAIKSSGLSIPASSISLEVKTLMAIGTSCKFSSTLRADTTTSSKVGSASKLIDIKRKLTAKINLLKILKKIIFYPSVKTYISNLYMKITIKTNAVIKGL